MNIYQPEEGRAQRTATKIFCLGLLGGIIALGIVPAAEQKPWREVPWHGQVMRNIAVLRDLDTGDLQSARRRLSEDSMECAFGILASLEFTTNFDTLMGQPGLRAAAKYWGGKSLPQAVPLEDAVRSNVLYQALGKIKMELNRRQHPASDEDSK